MTAQSVIQPHLLPLKEPNVHTNFAIPHRRLTGFVPMVGQPLGRRLCPHFAGVHALLSFFCLGSIFTALTRPNSHILVIRFRQLSKNELLFCFSCSLLFLVGLERTKISVLHHHQPEIYFKILYSKIQQNKTKIIKQTYCLSFYNKHITFVIYFLKNQYAI